MHKFKNKYYKNTFFNLKKVIFLSFIFILLLMTYLYIFYNLYILYIY